MRYFYLLVAILLAASFAQAEELLMHTALNGKVTIASPKIFRPMPQEILETKYPNAQRPTEVISDPTYGVSLAFNHTKYQLLPTQIKQAHNSMSKMFHKMFPSADWIIDEVKNIKGRDFMVFEIVTPASDTQIHNIMYGTSVDNRFLLISFNTTVEQSGKWLPIGKRIMDSISIN